MPDGPIARAFVEIESDTDNLRASAQPGFEALEAAARASADEVADAYEKAARRIRTALNGASPTSMNEGLARSAQTVQKTYGKAFDEIDRRSSRSFGFIRAQAQITASAVATSGFFALLAGATAAPAFAVGLAADIEQLQIGIANLVGAQQGITDLNVSLENSAGIFSEIAEFATTTPFSFQGVAENFQQLLAAGRPLAGVFEDLNAIGGVSAALGVKPDEIQFVIRALAQINNSTKVYQQDLNQITQRFPGFNARQELSAQLAEKLGVSVEEASLKISEGAITGSEGVEMLLTAMHEFGPAKNALEAQLSSLTGQFQRFKEIVQLSTFAAVKPLLPSLKVQLDQAGNQVRDSLDALIPAFGGFAIKLVPLVSRSLIPFTEIAVGLFDGLERGLPSMTSALEAFEKVAPSLADAVGNLADAGIGLLDVAAALTPALQLAADIIAAMPPSVITLATAFHFLNSASLPLSSIGGRLARLAGFSGGTAALNFAAEGIYGLAGAFSKLGPLGTSLGLIGAVSVVTALVVAGKESGALDALAGGLLKVADSVAGFDSHAVAGATADIQGLIGGFDLSKLNEQQIAIEKMSQALREVGDVSGVAEINGIKFNRPTEIFDSHDNKQNIRNAETIEQLNAQIDLLNEQARLEIEAGIATGRFTDEQIKATAAQTDREGPASAIVRQLELLQAAEDKAAAAAEVTVATYGAVARQFASTGDQLSALRETVPGVASAVQNLRLAGEPTEAMFLDFALAAGEAKLSEDDMANAAALLGVDVNTLSAYIETATKALDDFVAQALGGLPSVESVLSDVKAQLQEAADAAAAAANEASGGGDSGRDAIGRERAALRVQQANRRVAEAERDLAQVTVDARGDGAKAADLQADREDALATARLSAREAALSLQEAEGGLAASAPAVKKTAEEVVVSANQFADGLKKAAERVSNFRQDLKDLSEGGFSDIAGILAEQGLEAGGALADELATALESGNTEILKNLQDAAGMFEDELLSTEAFLRDELGPRFILQAGLLGEGLTASFAEGLDFGERIEIAAFLAKSTLDEAGQGIAAVAIAEGEEAAQAYGDALNLDDKTIDAALAVAAEFNGEDPGGAVTASKNLGFRLVDGVSTGMTSEESFNKLRGAAQIAIQTARAAMEEEAQVHSPSRLFAKLGRSLTDGVAAGIVEGIPGATDAMGKLVGELSGAMPANLGVPSSGQGAQFGSTGTIVNQAPLIERLLLPTSDPERAASTIINSVTGIEHAVSTR